MASGDGGAMRPVLSDARDAISSMTPSSLDLAHSYGFSAPREWESGQAATRPEVEFPVPSSEAMPKTEWDYLDTAKPQVSAETARMAHRSTMGSPPPPRMATPAQAVGRAYEMTRQRPPGIPELQPHNFRRDQLRFPKTPEEIADAEAAKRNERLLGLKPQVDFPEEAPPRQGDDSMGRLFERSAANGFPVSAAPPGTVGPGPRQITRPTLSGAAAEQEQARGEVMDALAAELGVGPGRTMDPVADQSERILRQKGMIASGPGVPQVDFPLRGRPEEPGSGGRRLAALADTARTVREQAEAQERSRALAEAAAAAKKQREIDEANAAAAKAEQEAERLAAAEEQRKRAPVAGMGGVMIDPLERATADVDLDGRYRGPKGSRAAPFALSAQDLGDITGGAVQEFGDLGAQGLEIDYGMLADKMGLPADMPADEREERAKVFLGDQVSRSKNNDVRQARGGGSYFTPSQEARDGYERRSMAVEAAKIKKTWPTMSQEASAALDDAVAKGDRRAMGTIRRQLYDDQNQQAAAYIRDRNAARAVGANLRDPNIGLGMFHRSVGMAQNPQDQARVLRQFGMFGPAAGVDSNQTFLQDSANTLEGTKYTADAGVKGQEALAKGTVDAARATADGVRAKTEAAREEAARDRESNERINKARNDTELKVAGKTLEGREAANKPDPLPGDRMQHSLAVISEGLLNGTYPDAQQAVNQFATNIVSLGGGTPDEKSIKAIEKQARTELIRSVLGRTDAMKNPVVLALIEKHVADAFPSPVGSYVSNPLGQSGAERAAQEFQTELAALGIEPNNAQTAELYKYLWNRRTSGR